MNSLMPISPVSESFRRIAEHCAKVGLVDAAVFAHRTADDLQSRSATVLVCGEFKRGKSSVINALLDEVNLLTVDIVPATAVVTVIRHGDRRLIIHPRTGQQRECPLTAESLRNLASDEAGGTQNPEDNEFIEVLHPAEILRGGLVLVDTPGTNDLCTARAEVVYKMIPRADAVIFVLDATTQITATEKAFLADRLLASLAPPLLFALNKIDRVESDERDEVANITKEAIRSHLPAVDLRLVMTSAVDQTIGVNAVREYLKAFILGEERVAARRVKQQRVFAALRNLVLTAIAERQRVASLRGDDLRHEQERAEQDQLQLGARLEQFRSYMHRNGHEVLLPMIRASLSHHLDEVGRRLAAEARTCGNPSQYAQHHLSLQVEGSLKQWLERKAMEITQFSERYQRAMVLEFLRHFDVTGDGSALIQRQHLGTHDAVAAARLADSGVHVDDIEQGGAMMRFGLPAAGALVASIVAGGGIALILGGLAGNLFAQGQMKSKQEAARDSLAAQIPAVLIAHGEKFLQAVSNAVDHHFNSMNEKLDQAARKLTADRLSRIQAAQAAQANHASDLSEEQEKWDNLRREVESLCLG